MSNIWLAHQPGALKATVSGTSCFSEPQLNPSTGPGDVTQSVMPSVESSRAGVGSGTAEQRDAGDVERASGCGRLEQDVLCQNTDDNKPTFLISSHFSSNVLILNRPATNVGKFPELKNTIFCRTIQRLLISHCKPNMLNMSRVSYWDGKLANCIISAALMMIVLLHMDF